MQDILHDVLVFGLVDLHVAMGLGHAPTPVAVRPLILAARISQMFGDQPEAGGVSRAFGERHDLQLPGERLGDCCSFRPCPRVRSGGVDLRRLDCLGGHRLIAPVLAVKRQTSHGVVLSIGLSFTGSPRCGCQFTDRQSIQSLDQPPHEHGHDDAGEQGIERHRDAGIGPGSRVHLECARRSDAV